MRWISRLLRRRPEPAPQDTENPPKTPGQKEAERALSRTQDARQEILANRPEVTHRASRLKRERQENHFAELFRAALEGGHR
jgi:hypothetical protein